MERPLAMLHGQVLLLTAVFLLLAICTGAPVHAGPRAMLSDRTAEPHPVGRIQRLDREALPAPGGGRMVPVPGPDLVVEAGHIELLPGRSIGGQKGMIVWRVRNQGQGAAGASTLRLECQGANGLNLACPPDFAPHQTKSVPPLAAGQQHEIQIPGDGLIWGGLYEWTATADHGNAVSELVETNNQKTAKF